jgi:glycosyltransferase involved in cell wall biosynthesis
MISICNVTKNRNENLEKCWKTWLFADEVIIMDYGSDIPVKIDHPKVKVYRYESKKFSKTKGLNMAIGLAKGNIIIQVDSDYYFHKQFNESDIRSGEFITGQNLQHNGNRDIISLTGFCMYWKYDWEKVNGYNERLIYYGYEDNDFYLRMEKIGLQQKKINPSDITHLTHSDRERLIEFGIDGSPERMLNRSCKKNRLIATQNPWSSEDVRSHYPLN